MRCASPDWNAADPWGMGRMHRRMHRQMRRDQRAAHLRNMRRMRDMRRQGACGRSWPFWMIFPIVFGVLPALRSMDWPSFPAMDGAAMALSPLTPVSRYFGDLLGVDPGLANVLLLAAVAVNAGAVLLALRAGRPRA